MRAFRSVVVTLTSLALALPAPLRALGTGGEFAPVANDDIARRCDAFSSVYDVQYTGPHTRNASAALLSSSGVRGPVYWTS